MKNRKINQKVAIVMGSQSDYSTMQFCEKVLKVLKIKFETKIVSAHRTPDRMYKFASMAEINGISVDINKLKSSSTDLRKTYPGIFGDILPSSISDLGIFELSGYLKYSNNIIQSSFKLFTDKGSVTSDLNISDFGDIYNSKYEGIFI